MCVTLARKAQREEVWHKRLPRPLVSQHRRREEPEALRRMNKAARTLRVDVGAQTKLACLEKMHRAKALRANLRSVGYLLKHQEQMEREEEERWAWVHLACLEQLVYEALSS